MAAGQYATADLRSLRRDFGEVVEGLKEGKEVSDGQVVRLDDALFAAAEDEVEAALKHFRFKKARALHEKSRATHENLHQYARRSHARLG